MYNHVVAKRSGIAWQPGSQLHLRRSELGYDSTAWGEDTPQEFSDAPYPENPDGFATDAYTSVTQTLTEQARLSLALLQQASTQHCPRRWCCIHYTTPSLCSGRA